MGPALMGVFTVHAALRSAAIDAGHELGLFEVLSSPLTLAQLASRVRLRPTHRLAALVDALVALGALTRGDAIAEASTRAEPAFSRGLIPPPSAHPLSDGWGAIADVIRRDAPLAIDDADIARRYQQHLVHASAPAAREVAAILLAHISSCPPAGQENSSKGTVPFAGSDVRNSDNGVGGGSEPVVREARVPDADVGGDARLRVVDIGGGAGAYTRAMLLADPRARATLVDAADVVELARAELVELGDRVHFVAGDARFVAGDARFVAGDAGDAKYTTHASDAIRAGTERRNDANDPDRFARERGEVLDRDSFDLAILANVLHLHSPAACIALCASAARVVRVGGWVAVVDLRRGTLEGDMFALNMALYTDGGSVWETERIERWLCDEGLDIVEVRALDSAPEMVAIIARRSQSSTTTNRAERG
jgi:SAM-dependent methyltransferase